MSIFSPLSSFTIFWTLAPLGPTHAPIGSTFSSWETTAILLLEPASLEILFISTTPSYISGTSNSNNLLTNPGCVLETIIWAPFEVFLTSTTYNLIFSLNLYFSLGICSFGPIAVSSFPMLTKTFPLSSLKTVPVIISYSFSLYSPYIILLSASLILWVTTPLASWAATLPKFFGVTSKSTTSSKS